MTAKSNANSYRVGSLPGIRRLPSYLHILRHMQTEGREIVSAILLAEESGQATPVAKKDIEMTGAIGKPGVGYAIPALIADIENFLGWNNPNDAVLVGVGNLGAAILGYDSFRRCGVNFVAAFDSAPDLIGQVVHGVHVLNPGKIQSLLPRLHVKTAVMTVPAAAAQGVADILVAAGVVRIWNFAPVMLAVPTGVLVQREDLAAGLAELLVRGRMNEEAVNNA